MPGAAGGRLTASIAAVRSVHTGAMDTVEARELLARERERIERALAELADPETDPQSDPADAGDNAPELLDAEIDEGVAEPLREELAAIERAEAAPRRWDLRPVGRERRADPRRAPAEHPLGRAHRRGAGALRVLRAAR